MITEAVIITAPPTPAPTPTPTAVPRETFGLMVQYNHIKGSIAAQCFCSVGMSSMRCLLSNKVWNLVIGSR